MHAGLSSLITMPDFSLHGPGNKAKVISVVTNSVYITHHSDWLHWADTHRPRTSASLPLPLPPGRNTASPSPLSEDNLHCSTPEDGCHLE